MAALRRSRDRVVVLKEQARCVGGGPLGCLAAELAESEPTVRPALAVGFRAWQVTLAGGLRRLQETGELAPEADVERLALGHLAACRAAACCSRRRNARRRPAASPVRQGTASDAQAFGRTNVFVT